MLFKKVAVLKKIILSFLLIIFTIPFVFSQANDFKPYSSFGIKQGLDFSSVLFVPSVKENNQMGYIGGLVYKYQNERLFGLQIELNYIQKGWNEKFDSTKNSYSRRLEYIELPFITHIVFGKKNLKYYVNLGTAVRYFIGEKENKNLSIGTTEKEYYGKNVENKVEYSALAGAGFVYHSGIGEFQVGFRYQLTFTDIFKTTDQTYYYQSQNSLFAISVTYFIFSNKKM